VRHSRLWQLGEIRASHISESHRRQRGRSIAAVFTRLHCVFGINLMSQIRRYETKSGVGIADIYCQKTSTSGIYVILIRTGSRPTLWPLTLSWIDAVG